MTSGRRAAVRDALPTSVVMQVRSAKRALRRRPSDWLVDALGEGESHGVRVRPLERGDEEAWREAVRANYVRMNPWWSFGDADLEAVTDRFAFAEHLHAWQKRLRTNSGACLAFVGPEGLVGEVQLWHVAQGGKTCEIGLWAAPTLAPEVGRGLGGGLGYVLDRLFDEAGIERVDAPVAAANELPRPLLRLGGFEIDASVPKWRELHGELVDYDLFGLTPQRWAAARERGWAVMGPWGPAQS